MTTKEIKNNLLQSKGKALLDSLEQQLQSVDSKEAACWKVIDEVIGQINYQDGMIYLYDEKRNSLYQTAGYGDQKIKDRTIINPIIITPGEGIVGRVFEYESPKLIGDTSRDTNYIVDDRYRFSEITIPVFANGKVIGVIDSEHSEEHFFTKEDEAYLIKVAELLGACLAQLPV